MIKKFLIAALFVPLLALAQTYPSPRFHAITLDTPLPSGSGGTGAASLGAGTVTATGGTTAISLSKWQSFQPTAQSQGAACNGSTNDTTAITALEGLGGPGYLPYTGNPCLTTLANDLAVVGPLRGPGQVKTADGNLAAPIMDVISSKPSPLGNWNASILTAFNGNLSHVPIVMGHVITGATTLGQPSSGESEIPETAMIDQYLYNSSGYECDNSGATQCRTLAAGNYFFGTQAGQADYAAWVGNIFIAANNPSATSWLAAPAANIIGGQITAGANHVYMEPVGDIDCVDGGFDTACIGAVFGLDRTNNTSGLGEPWMGVRVQSTGTKNTDSFFTGAGKGTIGLDLVNTSGMGAALAFPVGSGIYGNATNPGNFPNTISLGTDEIVDSVGNGWEIIQGGVDAFNVKSTQIGATVPVSITASGTGLGVTNNASIGGTLAVTGALTPSQTNGIVGTTTNNSANAGSVGELVTNFNTATSLTNNTAANSTSVSLTAGDWDVECTAQFAPAGSTTVAAITASVNTTSATIPGSFSQFTSLILPFTTGSVQTISAPIFRESLASTTTVYCPVQAIFGVSTMTVNGNIRARRIR